MLNSLLDTKKRKDATQGQRTQSDTWMPEKMENMRLAFEATRNNRPGIYELWPDERIRQYTVMLMEQKRLEAEMASTEDIVQDEREWEELKQALNANRTNNQESLLF